MTSFEKHLSEPIQNILPFLWWGLSGFFVFVFFYYNSAFIFVYEPSYKREAGKKSRISDFAM